MTRITLILINVKNFNDIGIKVIDCEESYSIEQQVFNDVPWNVVKELIQVAVRKIATDDGVTDEDAKKRLFDCTNANLQNKIDQIENWCDNESVELRQALGVTAKKEEWYKRQTYGEFMGECIFTHYSELSEGCRLKSMIDALSTWIDE